MQAAEPYFPDSFSEWNAPPLRTLPRRAARRAAIAALYAKARLTGDIDRGLKIPRVQFYCLHHLFKDEEAGFRDLMKHLSRYYHFASWSEGVRMVLEGRRPDRPVACFSSDDGFESNLRLAKVLEEFGTTGCFFINPASLARREDEWVARFCRVRLQARPSRFLDQRQVEGLLKAGHEIGNHTTTHVVCSETPFGRLASEIESAKEWLERRFGPVLHFAWPYGQVEHCSRTAKRLIFEAGHISASSVVRGAHLHSDNEETPEDVVICRDQIWAADPIKHTLYFSARNALSPGGVPVNFPRYTQEPRSQLAHWSAVDWPQDSGTSRLRPDRNVRPPAAGSVRAFALDRSAERPK